MTTTRRNINRFNPLASLRSAIDTLPRVEDPDLRAQLIQIATHDVRRIDRLGLGGGQRGAARFGGIAIAGAGRLAQRARQHRVELGIGGHWSGRSGCVGSGHVD